MRIRLTISTLLLAIGIFGCANVKDEPSKHVPFDTSEVGALESFREEFEPEEADSDGDEVVISYYPDSTRYEQYYLLNGKMNGTYVQYYRSGNIKKFIGFKEGVLHDEAFYFYDAISPRLEVSRSGGDIDTITRKEPYSKYQYYSDGDLVCTVTYNKEHLPTASYGSFISHSQMKREYHLGQNIAVRINLIEPPYVTLKAFLSTDSIEKQNIPFIELPNGQTEFDLTPYIHQAGSIETLVKIESYKYEREVLQIDVLKSVLNVRKDSLE